MSAPASQAPVVYYGSPHIHIYSDRKEFTCTLCEGVYAMIHNGSVNQHLKTMKHHSSLKGKRLENIVLSLSEKIDRLEQTLIHQRGRSFEYIPR
jgi:hypothetical protein